jgi:hypothetical protein
MRAQIIASSGNLRLRMRGDGNCELILLSYMDTVDDLPRPVHVDVIEQFYSAEDGLRRLCEMNKH